MWGGGAQIRKVDIPTYWQHNEIPGAALAICGECNGQIQFHPRRLVWHHLDPELSPGCPDLDLTKPSSNKQVLQVVQGKRPPPDNSWIESETIEDIDWSWIGRFGRGLAYGWIQVLAELYLPWIGLGCYKIHTLLRRNA